MPPLDLENQADEDLCIRYCKENDDLSYAIIYARYWGSIFRCCNKLLKNDRDAQEATQETFLAAYEKCFQFDQARGSFQTWIYRIATNKCFDLLRKRRPEEPLDVTSAESDDTANSKHTSKTDSFENQLIAKEVFEKWLEALTVEQRIVVSLKYEEDFTWEQIAETTGFTVWRCRKLVQQTHKILQTYI